MRRVLLVDGNVHVLHVMKSSLDRHGYEVDTALAIDFARSLYRESRHDVVIVDGDAHAGGGEHARVRAGAFDVVGEEPPIEADRRGEGGDEGIGRLAEASAPQALRRRAGRDGGVVGGGARGQRRSANHGRTSGAARGGPYTSAKAPPYR